MNEISPEATYQQIKNKKEVTTAAGAVCGMSYEQKGICYERLARDIMCLAGPSQDLYTDYYRFLWAYDEITDRQKRRMEYCIIGMSAYRLWWDLSRGSQSLRVLGFYPQTKKLHHLDWAEDAAGVWEDRRICEKLMGQDFLERDFFGRFPGIAEICETKREEIYTPSKEQREGGCKVHPAYFSQTISRDVQRESCNSRALAGVFTEKQHKDRVSLYAVPGAVLRTDERGDEAADVSGAGKSLPQIRGRSDRSIRRSGGIFRCGLF